MNHEEISAIAIPGLGMAKAEIPDFPGLLPLENPEIGPGAVPPTKDSPVYTARDLAETHVRTIESLAQSGKLTTTGPLWVIGMSMGGMIAAILASDFRKRLPRDTRFAMLVTSGNTQDVPAASDERLEEWRKARPGDVESYRQVMSSFFSPGFRQGHPDKVESFYQYRAQGGNGQTPRALMRQMTALRNFDGPKHYGALNPREVLVVSGDDDLVFGPRHAAALKKLIPAAHHVQLPGIGHMINQEYPEAFQPWRHWST